MSEANVNIVASGPVRPVLKVRSESSSAKRGFCEHGRKKSRCRECGGGSFCEHNVQRYNCHKCIQARCIASLVESLRSTVASTIGGASDQAKIMLLELQVKAITEQRDSLLQILEQNQLFAMSQVGYTCMSCMQKNGSALNVPLSHGPVPNGPLFNAPLLSAPISNGTLLSAPMSSGTLFNAPLLTAPLLNGPMLNGPILNGTLLSGPLLNVPLL